MKGPPDRGHSLAKIMEVGKDGLDLVRKAWGRSSEWEQVGLWAVWQRVAFERLPELAKDLAMQ